MLMIQLYLYMREKAMKWPFLCTERNCCSAYFQC